MLPLPHGYTNTTLGDDVAVLKRYRGPDADLRRQREHAMLVRLPAHLPVPRPLDNGDNPDEPADDGAVRMSRLAGAHGQDLIDQGHAAAVLRGCGQVLREIHAVDVAAVFPSGRHHAATVVVHDDFGPNNLLFDPETFAVTAALDYRDRVDALGSLFAAYGHQPTWQERQDAMAARCRSLREWCLRWTPESASEWQRRLAVTEGWLE